MITWIVALLAVGSSAPNITLTVRGATVAHVIDQIAERTGLPLRTKAPIQHHMLLIDVKDAPVEELLARIAEATYAEWLDDNGTRVLTRSPKLQKSMEEADLVRRAKEIDKVLGERLQAQRPWTQERCRQLVEQIIREQDKWAATYDPAAEVALRQLRRELPIGTAAVRMLAAIGGKTLAGVGTFDRVVFSNRPTARQVLLPPSGDKVFRELSQQVAELEQEVRRQSADRNSYFGLRESGERFTPETRVLLVVRSYSANLKFSGDEGYGTYVQLSGTPQMVETPEYPQDPFALSEEGAWVASYWQANATRAPFPKAEGRTREMLLSPAKRPRVGTLVFDALKGLADHDHRQLVAWIPLVAHTRAEVALSSKQTLTNASLALTQRGGCELRRSANWLVARHTRPISAGPFEFPREPIERYVRHVDAVGAIRVLDIADLLSETGTTNVPYEGTMLGYGQPLIQSSPLIPLLGSLSPSQREAAFSPSGIALGRLAPSQLKLAEKAVYAEDDWYTDPFEVTDVFPSGLPRQAVFRVVVEQVEYARPWLESATDIRMPFLDLERLVAQIANRLEGRRDSNEAWEGADRYHYGTQSKYTLSVEFGTRGSVQVEAREPSAFTGKPIPWQKFPESFRAKIEKLLKDRRLLPDGHSGADVPVRDFPATPIRRVLADGPSPPLWLALGKAAFPTRPPPPIPASPSLESGCSGIIWLACDAPTLAIRTTSTKSWTANGLARHTRTYLSTSVSSRRAATTTRTSSTATPTCSPESSAARATAPASPLAAARVWTARPWRSAGSSAWRPTTSPTSATASPTRPQRRTAKGSR